MNVFRSTFVPAVNNGPVEYKYFNTDVCIH